MADRLKVCMRPKHGSESELTPLLCDAEGTPLPGQLSVQTNTAVDDFATVTVTFAAVEFA